MTDTRKPFGTVRIPGGLRATIWLNASEKENLHHDDHHANPQDQRQYQL